MPGTSPTMSPPRSRSTGYGTRIRREIVTSTATTTRRARSSSAAFTIRSARCSVVHAALRHREWIENPTEILVGHDLFLARHVEQRPPLGERLLHERRGLRVADVRRERGHDKRWACVHQLLRAVLVDLEPGDGLLTQHAHRIREGRRRETVREVDAGHHHVELELPSLRA